MSEPNIQEMRKFRVDWTQSPKSLRNTYKLTKFDSIFHKLITKEVIRIFSPQLVPEPHNLIYDDEKVHRNLISPLERFIFDLDLEDKSEEAREKVNQMLTELKGLKQSSKMCRKVVKTGDVLFSCNDCGLDATCVVCIDCFLKSEHRNHNYRMSNTDGGGCCDCGDIEAWKQHPACIDHSTLDHPNLILTDFEDKEKRDMHIERDRKSIFDKIALLPDADIACRFFLVCQACLHYARMMLSWEDFKDLPEYLKVKDESFEYKHLLTTDPQADNFFTVLFNDEVHTYDHVINTLVKVIKCSKMTASIMASSVSREGRSYVWCGPDDSCYRVKEAIGRARESNQGPLKVEVVHGTILAHQAYALKLIQWFYKMSLTCDAFRVIIAHTLLGDYDPIPNQEYEDKSEAWTLLEKIMMSNTSYWKAARILWNDLFVSTLLVDYSVKTEFARLITKLYPRLVDDYIKDDHDQSVSILTMTTQLYTVPSMVCMIIEEENALSIIARTLVKACSFTKFRHTLDNTTLGQRYAYDGLRRGYSIIQDLRHLISLEPTIWSEKFRDNVVEAIKIFLELLQSMQGMDSVKRQVGQHLEYEPEWETGINLQGRLIGLIERLVTYCSIDEQVLIRVLSETQRLLFDHGGFKKVLKEIGGFRANCIQYDVSSSPVSVHLPLTRFAASLILELMRRRPCDTIPYDESLVILSSGCSKDSSRYYLRATQSHSMIEIMEHSLRTAVMIAQFRSSMWRRNGFSLANQISFFTGALMRKEMFDRDILCIQEAAATCEANTFMLHLLNKFNLFNWVLSETTREPTNGPKAMSYYDEETFMRTMSMGEEFLQLLLTIIGERYRVGVGRVETDDCMKNEIIHLLCIEPLTRSDLAHKLSVNDTELDCVKEVANLRRTDESSLGKYELKPEFYHHFNPFFYHYHRRQQSQAMDSQLKRKRNMKEQLICCPPPPPVELTDQFKNLRQLLECEITLMITYKILHRALGNLEDAQECSSKVPARFTASDLQLDQCLHLIGLGLYEQERDPTRFNYLMRAQTRNVFRALRECYDKAKRSKDLIHWIMKKAIALIDRIDMIHANNLDEQQSRIYSQIRELFEPILSTCDNMRQESRKRTSELATQRRERIMAMMKAKQDKFLSNPTTKQLAAETAKYETVRHPTTNESLHQEQDQHHYRLMGMTTSTTNTTTTTLARAMDYDSGLAAAAAAKLRSSGVNNSEGQIAYDKMDAESIGGGQAMAVDDENEIENLERNSQQRHPSYLCILCRDEQCVDFDQPTMVLLAHIQRSAVLSKNRAQSRIPYYSMTPSNQIRNLKLIQSDLKVNSSGAPEKYSFTSDNSWAFDATFMPSDLFFGPYISTCGHVMHYDCWKGYSDAVSKREASRPSRTSRHVSFELERNELLCPLCECISNATIPLLPEFTDFRRSPCNNIQGGIFGARNETIEKSCDEMVAFVHAIKSSVSKVKRVRHLQKPTQPERQQQSDDKYIRLLQPVSLNDTLKELTESEAFAMRDFLTKTKTLKISSSVCIKTLLASISALSERIYTVGLDLDRNTIDLDHARIFMMTSWSISYTIQAQERSSRLRKSSLIEDPESSRNLSTNSLIRFACASMMTHQPDMIQSLLVRKLRYLLISDEYLMSSPCCLDIDTFELFVSLFIMLQKLYSHMEETGEQLQGSASTSSMSDLLNLSCKSTGSSSSAGSHVNDNNSYAWTTRLYYHEFYRNLLHLTLLMTIVQVIVTMQVEENLESDTQNVEMKEDQPDDIITDHECRVVRDFYQDVLIAADYPNHKMLPSADEHLVRRVRSGLLPFLRSCQIFFYHLSNQFPPQESKESSGKHIENELTEDCQFKMICNYLSLPTSFVHLLDNKELCNLAKTWLRHSRVRLLIEVGSKDKQSEGSSSRATANSPAKPELSATLPSGESSAGYKNELMPLNFIRQPHSVNRLVDLPYDYSELVDRVSNFTCPSIKNEDSRTPTMCLVCGAMLCSQSYCCQRDLNNLASNYQEVVRIQEELHQLLGSAVSAAGGPLSGSGGSSHGYRTRSSRTGGQQQANEANSPSNIRFIFSPGRPGPVNDPNDPDRYPSGLSVLSMFDPNSLAYSPNRLPVQQQLVGSCTYHAYECSGGVGIFLRIRNCQVLLLSNRTKGCYMPAPYIDDHGETDSGLIRGNPLYLNQQHYERLQQLWMNHAIPEKISRTLEYSSHFSSINWHLH